ncbi:unnamed protein product [Adineta steineri]|uniref:G-protein coupled receptors family 1 profile domain-containing protein n=1 Tax=Adineta steineri TaxID=433720 RepID=A0A814BUX0_9BILA|nr:unnamed protein product [Adineta steineri]CAF0931480.1 unnamed protein product [Adineta steineri]
MSSSNTITTEADIIKADGIIFYQIWCYSMFTFGIIGHTLSIYVFTRTVLRSNPCSRYFLASTISGSCVVMITIPLRLLQLRYNINVFTNSIIVCKIVTLLLNWTRAQNAWFTAMACADRFLCSSASTTLRGFSSLRVTYRTIPLAILIVGLGYIHVPIYYQINTRQQTCVPIPGIYQTFVGVWNLVEFSLGPPIAMLYFGLGTVKNVRQSVGRIAPNSIQTLTQTQIQQQRRRKATDRQLIQMMFAQCIVFILTASLPSVQYIYASVRANVTVDAVQSAKDSLFSSIANFVSLSVPCMSFYLFTLSSKLFRNELMKLFNDSWRPKQINTTGINPSRKN